MDLRVPWFLMWTNEKRISASVEWSETAKKNQFFCNRQYFVGVVTIPQSKDSSSRSAWHSSRLYRSLSRWLQQLSGCTPKLRRSRSWANWCSHPFPPESTHPPPTQPHLPADRTYRYQLNSNQMLIVRMQHISYNFAPKMWSRWTTPHSFTVSPERLEHQSVLKA